MKTIETIYEAMAEINRLKAQNERLINAIEGILPAFWNDEPKDYHGRKGSYYEAIKHLYANKIEYAEQALTQSQSPESDIEQARRQSGGKG